MKYSKAVLASLLTAVVAGCSTLPTGHSSRSKANVEDLFTSDDSVVQTNQAQAATATDTGLRIKKSERGNMKSYVVRGQRFHTLENSDGYSARGLASWYGPNFHGQVASNGETYDMYKMTAAHKTLPLPTYARVTHLDSDKSVVVKINDRGPFSGDRLIDLSFAAALQLGMVNDGTAMVEIQALTAEEVAELSGPDNKLGVDFYTDEAVAIAAVAPPKDDAAVAVALPAVAVVEAQAQDSLQVDLANANVAIPANSAQGELLDLAAIESEIQSAEQPAVTEVAQNAGKKLAGTVQAGKGEPVAVVASNNAVSSNIAVKEIEVMVDAESTSEVRKAAGLPVDLIENASVGQPVPLTGLAAVQTSGQALEPISSQALPPISEQNAGESVAVAIGQNVAKVPVSGPGYYIQAGVYADVQDAEKIAVEVVLAIPLEEVHVKPLKGSDMYRITVGPIINSDHAAEVSGKLDAAGLDNYTVKVKAI